MRKNATLWFLAAIIVAAFVGLVLAASRSERRCTQAALPDTTGKNEIEVIAVLDRCLPFPLPSGRRSTEEPTRSQDVGAFIFRVIAPPDFLGAFFGLHHDGDIASGRAFALYEKHQSYQFRIPAAELLRLPLDAAHSLDDAMLHEFSFRLCSLRPLGKLIEGKTNQIGELTTRSSEPSQSSGR